MLGITKILKNRSSVPKRHCAHRAEWRLLRGKPAQPLSEHYQLDCDYGTALITIYNEGEGSDPIYLCETHAAAVAELEDSCSVVPSIEPESADGHNPTKSDERTQAPEPAVAEPVASTPSEAVGDPAATMVGREIDGPSSAVERSDDIGAGVRSVETKSADGNNPIRSDDRTRSAEFAVAEPVASTPSQAAGAPAAAKVGREIKSQPFSSSVRDLTFGNSAKALVDETIWNMTTGDYGVYRTALQQGKSAAEAAQAAGGQLAIVHRKISEYTLKIEAALSESKATISVVDVIDTPLENATLEIISNSALVDAEKDAAIAHLGGFQEWMNRGLTREMTPLQAHQIARAIGDRANWGVRSCLSEELKPAYRAVYLSIRRAVRAAVPGARDLDERLANLYAAKCDLENAPGAKP